MKSGASHGNHFHKHECGVSALLSGEPTLPLLSSFKWTFKRKQSFFYYSTRINLLKPTGFRGLVFGFLAFLVFLVKSEELACCINPQPGGPGDFWSRISFSSP